MPKGILDRDFYQAYCLFSPDFSMHLDIDHVENKWIIRETYTGSVFFRIPNTFLKPPMKSNNRVT